MIRSGLDWIQLGHYAPSRFQGHPVPEFLLGLTYLLLGSWGATSFVALLATLSLFLSVELLKGFHSDSKRIHLWLLIVGCSAPWVVNAITAQDSHFAIFGLLAGLYCWKKNWILPTAIFWAFSIGSRLEYAGYIGIVLLFLLIDRIRSKNSVFTLFATGFAIALFVILLYLPSWNYHEQSLSNFLKVGDYALTWKERLPRFLFKNLLTWGLIPSLILYASIPFFYKNIYAFFKEKTFLILCASAVIVLNQIIFIRLPQSVDYLLPTLWILSAFFVIVIPSLRYLLLSGFLVLLTLFITYTPFRIVYANPDRPEFQKVATGAKFDPHFTTGPLLEDLQQRDLHQRFWMKQYHLNEGKNK